MSAVEPLRSFPKSLFARAFPYQCPPTGAPVKSRKTNVAPALPRTADVALHVRASHVARTRIVTALDSVAPHLSAAAWKAISRCWPSVVPVLPPTGATTVGSLKPTPAGSPFWMTIVAAPKAGAERERSATRRTRPKPLRNTGRLPFLLLRCLFRRAHG